MLDLLEKQVEDLNAEEKTMVTNLATSAEIADSVLFTRRDSVKEKLMGQYRQKEQEIDTLTNKVAEMSFHEARYNKVVNERD
jgi:hypothetical protein